jgi:hypothetical protein
MFLRWHFFYFEILVVFVYYEIYLCVYVCVYVCMPMLFFYRVSLLQMVFMLFAELCFYIVSLRD